MKIKNHRHFADAWQYELDCPEVVWTARLDHKALGETSNLILYVTDFQTWQNYCFQYFLETTTIIVTMGMISVTSPNRTTYSS